MALKKNSKNPMMCDDNDFRRRIRENQFCISFQWMMRKTTKSSYCCCVDNGVFCTVCDTFEDRTSSEDSILIYLE